LPDRNRNWQTTSIKIPRQSSAFQS
jgi:hypothetical protein